MAPARPPLKDDSKAAKDKLVAACKKRDGPAETIPSPPATEMKDQIWHAIADAVGK